MSIALTAGGYVWREGDGWSGMFWRGDTAYRVPACACLGRAVGVVRRRRADTDTEGAG